MGRSCPASGNKKIMDLSQFHLILKSALKNKASDLHFVTDGVPCLRVRGKLLPLNAPPLTEGDLLQLMSLMTREPESFFSSKEMRDLDGSFEVKGLCRFRFNIFKTRGKFGVVLRVIPNEVPTLEKLSLPAVLSTIAMTHRGLVLVTGATGSGKSSTLAAMMNVINSQVACHILTIEDPIEYVHPVLRARVTQREVGKDTDSFSAALRAALRQDPDVILVGEMRDPETIDIALKAAETGHAVFSTVHTTDAVKTIARLISVFPPAQQPMVRLRLADNLAATVSQRLVRRADGKGMLAAQEIMISNVGIQECIAKPELTSQMIDYIAQSKEVSGGQTFDQHLVEMYRANLITLEDAKGASSSSQDFERNLMFGDNPGKAGEQSPAMKGMESKLELDRES